MKKFAYIVIAAAFALPLTSCAWNEEIATAGEHLSRNMNVEENPASMPAPDTTVSTAPVWSNDSVPIYFNVSVDGWGSDSTEVKC